MTEMLTISLALEGATRPEITPAVEEAFEDLESDLMGVGEIVGWDLLFSGVELYVRAFEPERVIRIVVEALRTLDVEPPWQLVATEPETGATLYARPLP